MTSSFARKCFHFIGKENPGRRKKEKSGEKLKIKSFKVNDLFPKSRFCFQYFWKGKLTILLSILPRTSFIKMEIANMQKTLIGYHQGTQFGAQNDRAYLILFEISQEMKENILKCSPPQKATIQYCLSKEGKGNME